MRASMMFCLSQARFNNDGFHYHVLYNESTVLSIFCYVLLMIISYEQDLS